MIDEVLAKYGPIGVDVLKMNVQRVGATGKTSESIHYEVTPGRLLLLARGYFAALETGRGPRTVQTYGEFDSHLDEWMQARGFESKVSKTGQKYYKIGDQWYSPKSLAWKINKSGDKLWRQGHGEKVRDVYSDALAKFVEELTQAVKKDQIDSLLSKVRESLKQEHGSYAN